MKLGLKLAQYLTGLRWEVTNKLISGMKKRISPQILQTLKRSLEKIMKSFY